MTGKEVLAAMIRHTNGRHKKGGMMLSGDQVRALVDHILSPPLESSHPVEAVPVWEGNLNRSVTVYGNPVLLLSPEAVKSIKELGPPDGGAYLVKIYPPITGEEKPNA